MSGRFGLGRRVEHDPRSRAFAFATAHEAPVRRMHRRARAVLNQGDVGACTGFAASHAMNCQPLRARLKGLPTWRAHHAFTLYSEATARDQFPGQYPPDDTGSSALGIARALMARGLITSYRHCFGLDHVLASIPDQPVMLGVNWYESMFNPDGAGFVWPSGRPLGGHEVLIRGVDPRHQYVQLVNSWGPEWGLRGEFRMSWTVLDRLLREDGDAMILLREETP